MIQDAVWAVSIVLMGGLAAVFVSVAAGANETLADYGPLVASAYRLRGRLFVIGLLVLIAANYKSLGELPYVSAATAHQGVAVRPVEAIGSQWSWSIAPNTLLVGETAEFHVTTKDVNHGFALYDPQMRIVAQTQAMPGYTNILRYTFTQPGTYKVLCLEYCGLEHHDMNAEIKVADH